jgi:glucose/arabinose dehydrogenase
MSPSTRGPAPSRCRRRSKRRRSSAQLQPPDYRGTAFAALHGSWNREQRTGYKIMRPILRDGTPTGEYEDFLTGVVTADGKGRRCALNQTSADIHSTA